MGVVRYQPVVHDGPHTMEQQMLLLAQAGEAVWRIWVDMDRESEAFKLLQPKMAELYRQLYQTDVFMGGLHEGQN